MYYWHIKLIYYTETTTVTHGIFADHYDTRTDAREWSFYLCTKTLSVEAAIRNRVYLNCPMTKRIQILTQTAISQDEFCRSVAD